MQGPFGIWTKLLTAHYIQITIWGAFSMCAIILANVSVGWELLYGYRQNWIEAVIKVAQKLLSKAVKCLGPLLIFVIKVSLLPYISLNYREERKKHALGSGTSQFNAESLILVVLSTLLPLQISNFLPSSFPSGQQGILYFRHFGSLQCVYIVPIWWMQK